MDAGYITSLFQIFQKNQISFLNIEHYVKIQWETTTPYSHYNLKKSLLDKISSLQSTELLILQDIATTQKQQCICIEEVIQLETTNPNQPNDAFTYGIKYTAGIFLGHWNNTAVATNNRSKCKQHIEPDIMEEDTKSWKRWGMDRLASIQDVQRDIYKYIDSVCKEQRRMISELKILESQCEDDDTRMHTSRSSGSTISTGGWV
jgi:hypothetical protein